MGLAPAILAVKSPPILLTHLCYFFAPPQMWGRRRMRRRSESRWNPPPRLACLLGFPSLFHNCQSSSQSDGDSGQERRWWCGPFLSPHVVIQTNARYSYKYNEPERRFYTGRPLMLYTRLQIGLADDAFFPPDAIQLRNTQNLPQKMPITVNCLLYMFSWHCRWGRHDTICFPRHFSLKLFKNILLWFF